MASIIKIVNDNASKASRLLARLLADMPDERAPCPIGSRTARSMRR